MGKIKFPIPAEEVVPHKSTMSLLGNVLAHDAKGTRCELRITPGITFFEAGRIEAWIGLEYMAQAVAAHAGMVARRQGKSPGIGFLLGTRQADFFTDAFRAGQVLHILVRHVWGEGELFSFDCSIVDASDQRCLATAQLNVYRPTNLKRIYTKEKI